MIIFKTFINILGARDDYFKINNERVNIGKIVVPTVTDSKLQLTSIRPKTASSCKGSRQVFFYPNKFSA